MKRLPIVVVGGGLAGVTAALDLGAAGLPVLLLESRPRLGGRAASGHRRGRPVDTGVHVILRCYAAYRALLQQLQVAHLVPIQDRFDVPVLRPGEHLTHLTRGHRGPPPLHLLPALLRYRCLSPASRVRAIAAGARLRSVDPDLPATDDETFGHWLDTHGQAGPAADLLWGLICTAALNIPPAEASLALATKVLSTGLIDAVDSGDIGVPAAPLSDLHDAPAREALARRGVTVRLGARVTRIERSGGPGDGLTVGFRDRVADGTDSEQSLEAEGLVLAVPHDVAARIVPREACPDASEWLRLGTSPIVNVHFLLDRVLLPVPFAAAPGSPLQWLFDRTAVSGGVGVGQQRLVASVSAADTVARLRTGPLLEVATAALQALLPDARNAQVVDAFVTREPQATFRQAAGSGRLRPPARTRWPRVVLAGAWTATGWPDTLEGAVRSGHTAAARLQSTLDRATGSQTTAPHHKELTAP
jgi:squalene-associated FAD-dependent desaturase